jgi:hypothetical protein
MSKTSKIVLDGVKNLVLKQNVSISTNKTIKLAYL